MEKSFSFPKVGQPDAPRERKTKNRGELPHPAWIGPLFDIQPRPNSNGEESSTGTSDVLPLPVRIDPPFTNGR